MFRIRKVYDATSEANREAIRQVTAITRRQFPAEPHAEIDKLAEQLRNPMKYRFRSILFVAENAAGGVRGYGLMLHMTDINVAYLELISAAPGGTRGGIGGALYERIRDESRQLGCTGLFFECQPDDPALCPDARQLQENRARLRFYERYGARPIDRTDYATPVHPGDLNVFYLVYDDLGQDHPLSRSSARRAVRAILERKYGDVCPPDYITRVVTSFRDDPVRLRARRYSAADAPNHAIPRPAAGRRAALVVNDRHEIHHVRERGYLETPVRIRPILREILKLGIFDILPPKPAAMADIYAVHHRPLVEYLRRTCESLHPRQTIYPEVFPIRNRARPPKHLAYRAGYYCIDPVTPITSNSYPAARGAVDCAMTAAKTLIDGRTLAYALVRPPGHHAERSAFGGFCYLNNAAVAAHFLSRYGRVAVLDIDYHHGNGTQEIFYRRSDVLTLSIHAHPRVAYPHFSGFSDEKGEGEGAGFNANYPLPEVVDAALYHPALAKALQRILRFKPAFLVVSLGLDPAKADPSATWNLTASDFRKNGAMIASLRLPTLVVQEGGYRVRTLGINARNFFSGLYPAA